MSGKLLEIACFSLESALIAQASGADRIELCENYLAGGFSPEISNVIQARKQVNIPLHVMVRPHPDLFPASLTAAPESFNYSEMEVQWMLQYVIACRLSGIDGIVFGALTDQKTVDITTCARLMEAAGTMSFTFHRAIDACVDISGNFKQIISLGIHRVLSSGGCHTALEGLSTLTRLQETFGDSIILMPGGGIRSNSIETLLATGCHEFHSAAYNVLTKQADGDEIRSLKKFVI